MAFYKREGDDLLSGPTVYGPEYTLTEENRASQQFPIDGWYWFDTLDEALNKLPRVSPAATVTRFQALAALQQAGLLDQVKTAIAQADSFTQLAWSESADFHRDSPTLNAMATALGWESSLLDQLFTAAQTIVA